MERPPQLAEQHNELEDLDSLGRRRSKRLKVAEEETDPPDPEEDAQQIRESLDAEQDDEPPVPGGDDDNDLEAEATDDNKISDNGHANLSDSDASEPNPEPSRRSVEQFREYCDTHADEFLDLTKEDKTSIRLMDVLKRKKAPLNAHAEVMEWHLRESDLLREHETLKDTLRYHHRDTLLKKLKPRYNLEAMFPKVVKVRLPSSKAVVTIPCRDAGDCIASLLTDPRIKDSDYLFHGDHPWAPPPDTVDYIEDLNTGAAFLKTHEEMVTKEGQTLLFVPMHIDGATTGQFADLPVTALKISLGIHNRLARDKHCAWRTMGWAPQVRKAKSRGKKLFQESKHLEAQDVVRIDGEGDTDSEDSLAEVAEGQPKKTEDEEEDEDTEAKAQDFHTITAAILDASGFKELQRTNMIWDLVFKNKVHMNTELLLVVPFVKCDTEEGDLLCGKCLTRTRNVKHVCRHCHCPMDEADDPRVRHKLKSQPEIEALVEAQNLVKLKAISQQHIKNAWYKVTFHQANNLGIHGACPSEMLHAILLGIFKYTRNIFFHTMGKESKLAEDINRLAMLYGKFLTRQSERKLPTTNFSKGIARGKLMATQCRGVLLIMAAVLRSSKGEAMLKKKKKFGGENGLADWLSLVELLLEWEACLCEPKMKKETVKKLERKHRCIMCIIRNVAKRTEGMGLKLMKFHAIVHLAQDVLLFGVPKEFDTGSNESHHKPTKTAAKLTQRKEASFNLQTAIRMTEFLLVELAMEEVEEGGCVWEYFDGAEEVHWGAQVGDHDDLVAGLADLSMEEEASDAESMNQGEKEEAKNEEVRTGGTRIRIFEDEENDNKPAFELLSRSKHKDSTTWPQEVVDFLNDLQNLASDHIPELELPVLTLHEVGTQKYHAHPNFQGLGPWKDWALVNWEGCGVLPCHLWCFVDLKDLPVGDDVIEHGGTHLTDGVCAVVECARCDENEEASDLFTPVELEVQGIDGDGEVTARRFYLADVQAIQGPCCVIPDIGARPNAHFRVKCGPEWSQVFIAWLNQPHKCDEMEHSDEEEDTSNKEGDGVDAEMEE